MPPGAPQSATDVESGTSQALDASPTDSDSSETEDNEVIVEKVEQPGIDSLRGTFGAIGTIIRNRRRTALTEAQDRSQNRNRRGSEASALASQSISEEPRQPGEEKDVEKLDLGRRYFGSMTRRPSQPTPSTLPSATEQPAVHSSPESEKPDPLTTPARRAPALHAHFDPNQQPPSSRTRTSSPPPRSNNTGSVRSRVDQSDQGPTGDKDQSPSA